MKQSDPSDFLEAIGLSPSQTQVEQILAYEHILQTRGPALGVVSKGDFSRLRERHILDCARAAAVAPSSGMAFDLGSGGGLPGILVAILRPDLNVRLVENRARRAAFLELVTQDLDLPNATVEAGLINSLSERDTADACLARALAPLEASWSLACPLLRPGGELIYFAGATAVVPAELPGASEIRSVPSEMLESAGPLVIITR